MVVRRNDRKKTGIHKKVAWALAASLVATPGMLGAHHSLGLDLTAHAADRPRDLVLYQGQTHELVDLSFGEHQFKVSSDALVVTEKNDNATLQAEQVGTYTVYVYELDGELERLVDKIRVTVKSHRREADTDGDGLIDIADIVAYLKFNPEVDLNHDGDFDENDIKQMLSWINSKYAEVNREPEFMAGDSSDKYWIADPPYEPDPIPLHDYFEDLDGDHVFFKIEHITPDVHADFKIINDALHYRMRESEETAHDPIIVTIRATDEHGAYNDGQFEIEHNRPPRFFKDEVEVEVVDLGIYYWERDSFPYPPIKLNLDDYFTDPDGDSLDYDYEHSESGDLIEVDLGENSSEMVIDLASGINTELSLKVTAKDPYGNSKVGTFTATFQEEIIDDK